MEALLETMAIGSLTGFLSFAFGVTIYVLGAVGIYTVAKRRGLRNPWLAWLPIGNAWILGSLSDQYRFSMKQKKTARRKVLMGLKIGMMAAAVLTVIVMVVMLVQAAVQFGYEEYYYYNSVSAYSAPDYSQAVSTVLDMVLAMMGLLLLIMAVCVVYLVFYYMCVYDLFVSCSPDNATLFLVLSILFSFLAPIFAFVCRNKDEGMRPRYQPAPAWQYPSRGGQPPYGQGGYYPPQPPVGSYPPATPYQQAGYQQPPAGNYPPAQPSYPQPPVQPEQPSAETNE